VVSQRVLVIALAPVPPDLFGDERKAPGENELELRLVSPASHLSRLQWLTNEEDEARGEAESRASHSAERVNAAASVEAEAGDTDPIQAAEDALRTFDADELVIVVPPQDEQSWLDRASVEDGFERFGRPVRYVRGEPDAPASS
jgi:hypothetical protein